MYVARVDSNESLLTLYFPGFIISFFLLVVFRLVIALSVPLLFIGALYGSMWLVQIYRTIRRGRASGLAAEYLVGVSVCRLYYLLCECQILRPCLLWLTLRRFLGLP